MDFAEIQNIYWSGHASLRRHYATFFVKYFLLSQLRTTHERNTFYFLTTHYAEGLDIHTYFTTQKAFQFEAQFVRDLSKLCVATQFCFSNTFYFRNYALRTTKILSTFFTTHYAEPPDIHTFVAHACPLQYPQKPNGIITNILKNIVFSTFPM